MATETNPAARLAAARTELSELTDTRPDCDEQEGAAFDVWIAELVAEIAELSADVTMDSKVWLVGGFAIVSGLGMSRIHLVATPRASGLVDLRVTSDGATFTATGLLADVTVRAGIELAISA